jgi:hypothetical protein
VWWVRGGFFVRGPVMNRAGDTDLRLAPPPPDDPECWKHLLNLLYAYEQDELFRWARSVREAVEEAKRKGAA